MHAITTREPGGPDVLQWTEVPDPRPGPGEVLLTVAATAVNRADLLQRQGHYPPPPGASDVIGLECSGTIAELGPDVTGWQVGDEVCALLAGGGYGEQVVVPAAQLLPVPDGVDLVTAASLPEVACTVWSNVVMLAHLGEGETFLVHGGAGGIGTHAIQVAKALGARVAVTAGSDERLARCRELGADIAVNYRTQDFVAEVGEADVVLDNMGAAYLDRNVDVLARDGRLVIIGMQGGVKGELNIGKLLSKRGSVSGTGLRSRPVDGPHGKARIVRDVRDRLWPLVASGRVKPIVHEVLPVQRAADAHRALEDGKDVFGKLVLEF
ncbi:putative PIG3 family NAD(P)H quinone oxidoreductase [Saccharothrix tamanrassetensis]|uniref:Putative PIG3 family NAD(P)H quinone oxidoreductase n=1 Tax=Saccharothrix tamanrassetensis TaxID=1051531 RepID=A0A841CNY6_9PSEU|nr:NAD(P)H-quinone oxidoreductase [Saccharothrix tamanrassetensis]MBB5958880.1 putative PIG3 family NAD(P)H quinone oxidoreductase [Saccharothrix tamanrassetensis]